MKRFISLFLCLLLCFSIVVPASASGLDSSTDGFGIDAFPYIQNTYISTYGKPAGTSFPVTIDFDQLTQYSYISFVISTNDNSCQFYSGSTQLTKLHIAGSMYRFYGITGSSVADSFTLSYVKGNSSSSYIRFVSFKVHPRDYFYPNQSINTRVTGSYTYQISNNTTGIRNVTVDIDDSLSFNSGSFNLDPLHANYNESLGSYYLNEASPYLTTTIDIDWKRFDAMDLYIFFNFDGFDSFSAECDGINVLSLIQEYPNDSSDGDGRHVISLDFSKLDPSINSDYVSITVRGYIDLDSNSSHQLLYLFDCVGFIKTVSANFWPSWLNKIIDKLDNIFTGRGEDQSAADSFQDTVDEQASQFEDMSNTMNQVERPDIESIDLSSSNMVDTDSVILATNGIGSILENPIILRVILMALTLALAGFVLYGKR